MKRATALTALSFGFVLRATTATHANFADDYLLANKYCGQRWSGTYWIFQLRSGLLMGKAPADWTDEDVAHLPDALKRCVQIARSRGVQASLMGNDDDTMSDRDYKAVIDIITRARAERSVEDDERNASQRSEAEDKKRAPEAALLERQKAEERLKQEEVDRVAATREAADKMAKDQADIATAKARRDAALAHQKELAMDAEANKAAAEAAEAEAAERQAAAAAAKAKARMDRAVADNRFEQAHPSILQAPPTSTRRDEVAAAGNCDVTYENYQSLRNGMSYREAAETLGCLGTEVTRANSDNTTIVTYDWASKALPGGNMSAMFQNNRLINKAQVGLR